MPDLEQLLEELAAFDLDALLRELSGFDLDAVLEEIARESERLLAGLSCQLYPDNPDT